MSNNNSKSSTSDFIYPLVGNLLSLFLGLYVQENNIVYIVIIGITTSFVLFIFIKEKLYRLLCLSALFIAIIVLIIVRQSYLKSSHNVRINFFENIINKISTSDMSEVRKCEKYAEAYGILHTSDIERVSPPHIENIKKAKECYEKIKRSDKKWESVSESYNKFMINKNKNNADNFLVEMNKIDQFDLLRSVREKEKYIELKKLIENDIKEFSSIMEELYIAINHYLDKKDNHLIDKINDLLRNYNKLVITYRSIDLSDSQYNLLESARRIVEGDGSSVKNIYKVKKESDKDNESDNNNKIKIIRDIYLDLSSLDERIISMLRKRIEIESSNYGYNIIPYDNKKCYIMIITPPKDGRVIFPIRIDDTGRYLSEIVINIIIKEKETGLQKEIKNYRIAGYGNNQSDALQAAMNNIAKNIFNLIKNIHKN